MAAMLQQCVGHQAAGPFGGQVFHLPVEITRSMDQEMVRQDAYSLVTRRQHLESSLPPAAHLLRIVARILRSEVKIKGVSCSFSKAWIPPFQLLFLSCPFFNKEVKHSLGIINAASWSIT